MRAIADLNTHPPPLPALALQLRRTLLIEACGPPFGSNRTMSSSIPLRRSQPRQNSVSDCNRSHSRFDGRIIEFRRLHNYTSPVALIGRLACFGSPMWLYRLSVNSYRRNRTAITMTSKGPPDVWRQNMSPGSRYTQNHSRGIPLLFALNYDDIALSYLATH